MGDSWISFKLSVFLDFWNRTFGGTPSVNSSKVGAG